MVHPPKLAKRVIFSAEKVLKASPSFHYSLVSLSMAAEKRFAIRGSAAHSARQEMLFSAGVVVVLRSALLHTQLAPQLTPISQQALVQRSSSWRRSCSRLRRQSFVSVGLRLLEFV